MPNKRPLRHKKGSFQMRPPKVLAGKIAFLALFAAWGAFGPVEAAPPDATPTTLTSAHVDHAGLKKLGWQLLVRSIATGDPSAFDAIDRLHAMVIHHIDLVEGQAISPEHAGIVLNLDLPPEQAKALLDKVRSVHMDFVTFSVSDRMDTEAKCRKVLDLAQRLKVKRIVCQPPIGMLRELDRLSSEFHIGVSIVNGSAAGPYQNPAAMLAALNGRSTQISACADLAEFRRGGISPLDAVKALSGRLMDVRLPETDETSAASEVESAPNQTPAVLQELRDQKFKGAVTVGQADPTRSIPLFIQSLNALSQNVTLLAR
jgi:sugar phosphate isomerase/epimerase